MHKELNVVDYTVAYQNFTSPLNYRWGDSDPTTAYAIQVACKAQTHLSYVDK
jgi:hypothetical protein